MPHPPVDRAHPVEPLLVVVDVTDTLGSGWRAGIQRVVVQLVDHLRTVDRPVRVVPVVWSRLLRGHRFLTRAELDELLAPRGPAPPAGPPAGSGRARVAATVSFVRRAAVWILRRVRLAVVLALAVVGLKDPVRRLLRAFLLRTVHRDLAPLSIGDLPPGSVLLDLDTVWNQVAVDRDRLYRELTARGVHVAVLVYDMLPVEHPEWFEDSLVEVFDRTLRAQATHAELVMAISAASARSFTDWAGAHGLRPPQPEVVAMGADAVTADTAADTVAGTAAELPAGIEAGRYVLVVGTVEPRKNHAVLLDAFDRLAARCPDLQLVIVGRAGWENDAVVRRLERHPMQGGRLRWLRSVGDAELARLYRDALVVAIPSATEGFGLPVIEAFGHGVPVVASDGGALPEAGGELAEYVAPADVAGWVTALERHASDPEHQRGQRQALAAYRPPRWADSAAEVADRLLDRFGT